MDAPADKEDVRPYLKVTALLEPLGVHVPHVHAQDVPRGLLLLEDLGTTPYLARLAAGDDPEPLYADALAALVKIQVGGATASAALAPYGRAELAREMALMPEWFLARHLALTLTAEEAQLLQSTFEFLTREALAQPAGVRAPRLPRAQPDAACRTPTRASSTSRTRCAARSATTSCRC